VQVRANLGGGGTLQQSANKYQMSPTKQSNNPYGPNALGDSYGGNPLLESPMPNNRLGVKD